MFDAHTIGFVGGGRVTRIILHAIARQHGRPPEIVVSDVNPSALHRIHLEFPFVRSSGDAERAPMECDVVFLALHPQALLAELPCLTRVRSDALVVSLAPRVTLDEIAAQLGGIRRIVRLIPNAPASIGDGFNPMSHSPSLSRLEVDEIRTFLSMLGDTPIVAEDELEAWAVITGMAPTYFWFQMLHLQQLATEFGLDETEARRGISETVMGAARMLGQSWLVPEEVLDLVPIHPLREDEGRIRATFDQRLYAMYERMAAQAMAAV